MYWCTRCAGGQLSGVINSTLGQEAKGEAVTSDLGFGG